MMVGLIIVNVFKINMNNTSKKWKSYLQIEFPPNFTQEHIEKLKISLQEILSINNPGAKVIKVDYTTNYD